MADASTEGAVDISQYLPGKEKYVPPRQKVPDMPIDLYKGKSPVGPPADPRKTYSGPLDLPELPDVFGAPKLDLKGTKPSQIKIKKKPTEEQMVTKESPEAKALSAQTGQSPTDAAAAINLSRSRKKTGDKPESKKLSDYNSLIERLKANAAYEPYSADESSFLNKARESIRANTNASLEAHGTIKNLITLTEDEIEKKKNFDLATLEMEEEIRNQKIAQQEAEFMAVNRLEEKLIRQNKIIDTAIEDELKLISEGQEMSGWDIFKKSALAVGAIAAAGATIGGSMALGKKGISMPNVFMPLIMKAINADIKDMERQKEGTRLRGLLDLKTLVSSNFKDEALRENKMLQLGLRYWDAKLEGVKKRLPADRQMLISNIQKSIQMRNQEEIAKSADLARSVAAAGAKDLNSVISAEDKLKSSQSNRNYMAINGIKALVANRQAKRGNFKELSKSQEDSLISSLKAVELAPKIKNQMQILLNKLDVGRFEQALELTFDDAFSRFREGEIPVRLSNLQNNLNIYSQTYAKMYEDRLSNEDRQFWKDVAGGNLDEYSIARAMTSVTQLEYWLRSGILGTVAGMDPESRDARFGVQLRAGLLMDVDDAIENYIASVDASVSAIRAGEGYQPFNVGIIPTNFIGPNAMRLQQYITDEYVSEVTADRRGVREYNDSVAGQTMSSIVDSDDGPVGSAGTNNIIKVEAADGTFAAMTADTNKQYRVLLNAAKIAGVPMKQMMPVGKVSVNRTAEDVKRLREQGYPAVDKGYHTEHGDFRAIDFNFTKGSKGHEFMKTIGVKLGWDADYDSEDGNHWVAPAFKI